MSLFPPSHILQTRSPDGIQHLHEDLRHSPSIAESWIFDFALSTQELAHAPSAPRHDLHNSNSLDPARRTTIRPYIDRRDRQHRTGTGASLAGTRYVPAMQCNASPRRSACLREYASFSSSLFLSNTHPALQLSICPYNVDAHVAPPRPCTILGEHATVVPRPSTHSPLPRRRSVPTS